MNSLFTKIRQFISFYHEGFRDLSWWGRRVWIIILIKLFIIFVILKIFFFKGFLNAKYDTDPQKSEYVLEQLINSKQDYD